MYVFCKVIYNSFAIHICSVANHLAIHSQLHSCTIAVQLHSFTIVSNYNWQFICYSFTIAIHLPVHLQFICISFICSRTIHSYNSLVQFINCARTSHICNSFAIYLQFIFRARSFARSVTPYNSYFLQGHLQLMFLARSVTPCNRYFLRSQMLQGQ